MEKNDWALACTRICLKCITTGNIGWLLFFIPMTIVLVKFSYSEIRQIVDDVFASAIFALGGWLLFILALVVGHVMFRLQAKIYERRISELTSERSELFKQLGITVKPSAPPDTLL